MTTRLVIVESPAKARTIAGYLGDDCLVESSVGHVRDLPQKAADVPETFKGEPWARLGVDVDNDFKPLYVVSPGKKDVVRDLKRALKEADELYLATDEDREGEAIAWHLLELLNPRVPVHRMVFHEITPEAIQRAISFSTRSSTIDGRKGTSTRRNSANSSPRSNSASLTGAGGAKKEEKTERPSFFSQSASNISAVL